MAIIPSDRYPGQVVTGDPGYPLGKAQNDIVEDDGVGTPLEALWVNDLFGFLQALLDEGGVTPSEDPDEVGASDYLTAIQNIVNALLAARPYGVLTAAGAGLGSGNKIPLTSVVLSGMTMATDEVTIPTAGAYLIGFSCTINVLTLTPPSMEVGVDVFVDAGNVYALRTVLYDNDFGVSLGGVCLAVISAGQKVTVKLGPAGDLIGIGRLTLTRVA